MKFLVNLVRILVGVLFIFSGLIKANDPLGLSYKMQEFFDVWGWSGLHSITLVLSIAMIAFEIIAGVAILVGWRMKLVSWLLLILIIFFSFLTGYAYLSGRIKECGCFGDCIPLKAGQSFAKDIVLLVLILLIFFARQYIKPLFKPFSNIMLLIAAAVFSLAFQWYVLRHLPVVDCLAYKKGTAMLEKMKIPAGAIPDSTVISFVYEKQGKQVEFTADAFPADFNDSDYHFVKRYDKLIRKGNAEPSIKDFSLTNAESVDKTNELLEKDGYKLLLFIHNSIPDGSWRNETGAIYAFSQKQNIPGYFITNLPFDELESISTEWTAWPAFRCDATAIKTAARTNPCLYLLKKDKIIQKWGVSDFGEALNELKQLRP